MNLCQMLLSKSVADAFRSSSKSELIDSMILEVGGPQASAVMNGAADMAGSRPKTYI